MPQYPITCNSCKHEWEVLMSIKAPIPHCPKCSSVDTKRLIGKTTFVLDDSGWSRQLYRKKSEIF